MKTCETCGQELPPDKLEEAGKRVAAEAERMWKLDIFDPPIGSTHPRASECLGVIAGIIRRNGWDWALPYRGNGPPQWCGMFAGDCWREAGLDPSWLATYFASTYRLTLWSTYQKFDQKSKPNPKPAAGAPRRLQADLTARGWDEYVEPRAGDIIIVGDGDPRVGDHVTVCMSYWKGVFDTISGNGGGVGPKGDKREGISRRSYAIGQTGYKPLWLIRPSVSDLL